MDAREQSVTFDLSCCATNSSFHLTLLTVLAVILTLRHLNQFFDA